MSQLSVKEEKLAGPIAYEKEVPEILRILGEAHGALMAGGLEAGLIHLVLLRASQINQCGFCVKMHVEEALRDGESADRLNRLIVWRHVDDFNEREKAALAWTEALTHLKIGADYGPLRTNLRSWFSDREISLLTVAISMINLWNRLQASKH